MTEFELTVVDGIAPACTVRKTVVGKQQYRNRIRRGLGIEIFSGLELEPKFGIPIVSRYCGAVPESWNPFCKRKRMADGGIHFYSNDYTFTSAISSPEKYVGELLRYPAIIGPDCSQYMDIPACVRFTNSYTNKAVTAYWQHQGVNVIPNVTWSDPGSYQYSVAGLPTESIIAINSTGAMKYNLSKYLWKRGYEYVIEQLRPIQILRFGPRMPYELENISLYFESEHLNRMRYGR